MNKRISMIRWGISFFIGMVACLLSSCDNGLDIQQAYPFTVDPRIMQQFCFRKQLSRLTVR